MVTIAQLKFDNKIGTLDSQFNAFDEAFKKHPEDFTSGKSLYTYFSLAVDLFNQDKKELQEIFDLYDIVTEKIDVEKNNLASKLTQLMDKDENGGNLTAREKQERRVYKNKLK